MKFYEDLSNESGANQIKISEAEGTGWKSSISQLKRRKILSRNYKSSARLPELASNLNLIEKLKFCPISWKIETNFYDTDIFLSILELVDHNTSIAVQYLNLQTTMKID